MSQFDVIWARLSRVLSFLLGAGILTYETVWDPQPKGAWLYFLAAGLMGLPVANAAQTILEKVAGKDPADKEGK